MLRVVNDTGEKDSQRATFASMQTDAPSLADALRLMFSHYSDGLRVCLPCRVIAWDSATPDEVTVQPTVTLVQRSASGARLTYHPAAMGRVPVAWSGGGSFAITHPLAADDTGR